MHLGWTDGERMHRMIFTWGRRSIHYFQRKITWLIVVGVVVAFHQLLCMERTCLSLTFNVMIALENHLR
jgi:hypothetical protein